MKAKKIMKQLLSLFAISISCLCCTNAFALDINSCAPSVFGLTVSASGSIKSGDLNKFNACGRLLPKNGNIKKIHLVISSNGGVLDEAIKIGKWARDNKAIVEVPDDGVCNSSCVYILAGGSVRWAYGNIGIHRPYLLSKPNISYDAMLKDALLKSRAYFAIMNVPENLADTLFSIPPRDIRILKESELYSFRLSQNDMAYEEEADLRNAEKLGISRTEYLKRQKLHEKNLATECNIPIKGPDDSDGKLAYAECALSAYKKSGL